MDYPGDLVALGLSMTEDGHNIEAAIENMAQHSDAKSRQSHAQLTLRPDFATSLSTSHSGHKRL
jgi:hypothetical protein